MQAASIPKDAQPNPGRVKFVTHGGKGRAVAYGRRSYLYHYPEASHGQRWQVVYCHASVHTTRAYFGSQAQALALMEKLEAETMPDVVVTQGLGLDDVTLKSRVKRHQAQWAKLWADVERRCYYQPPGLEAKGLVKLNLRDPRQRAALRYLVRVLRSNGWGIVGMTVLQTLDRRNDGELLA